MGASGSAGRMASIGFDPARIYKNPTPPPVTIEAIYEGDRRFSVFEASRLSKLPQNVRVEYTALSLSIPERVHFKYQLEVYDRGWQDVGTRRAAYYPKASTGAFPLSCDRVE